MRRGQPETDHRVRLVVVQRGQQGSRPAVFLHRQDRQHEVGFAKQGFGGGFDQQLAGVEGAFTEGFRAGEQGLYCGPSERLLEMGW